ncbi:hypothetical protein AAGR22_03505 [Erwinia sp. HDF1-3R]|uniref:hypothetical protein n=1 Tax=Erwinia sp. HDF1-3R TaxID=3141543 RepID=UPI0031F48C1A
MSTEYLFFSIVLFLFLISISATIVSYFSYKKNLSRYEFFLENYQQAGLFVDTVTTLASNPGFVFFYFKIVFFIRLLRRKKMYSKKGVLVDERCYHYMQSLPKNEIAWMWKGRRNYFIQSSFFIMAMLMAYIHSVIYHY